MCQNCKILVVEASSSSSQPGRRRATRRCSSGANVISNSWGADEFFGRARRHAAAFDHPWIPITFSTGDDGYGSTLSFPAVAEHRRRGRRHDAERRSDQQLGERDGVERSRQRVQPFFRPAAPQNTSMLGNWPKTECGTNRAVADVSADADPGTGAWRLRLDRRYHGHVGWFAVGGTSLASPIIAGAYALAGKPGVSVSGDARCTHKANLHDPTRRRQRLVPGARHVQRRGRLRRPDRHRLAEGARAPSRTTVEQGASAGALRVVALWWARVHDRPKCRR